MKTSKLITPFLLVTALSTSMPVLASLTPNPLSTQCKWISEGLTQLASEAKNKSCSRQLEGVSDYLKLAANELEGMQSRCALTTLQYGLRELTAIRFKHPECHESSIKLEPFLSNTLRVIAEVEELIKPKTNNK